MTTRTSQHAFAKEHGRAPTKSDIKEGHIALAYQKYAELKTSLVAQCGQSQSGVPWLAPVQAPG